MRKKLKGISLVLALGMFLTTGMSTIVSAKTTDKIKNASNRCIVRSVSTDPGEFPVAN